MTAGRYLNGGSYRGNRKFFPGGSIGRESTQKAPIEPPRRRGPSEKRWGLAIIEEALFGQRPPPSQP